LTAYSALLAQHRRGDTETLTSYDADGDDVQASLVLGQGTNLMAESTHYSIPEPDNADVVWDMHKKTTAPASPPLALPMVVHIPDTHEDFDA
jgi:hypothetical protein